MSDEFSALLAATTAERAHADAITSFVAQTRALGKWQHRAEVAEAALARIEVLCGVISAAQGDANYLAQQGQREYHDFLRDIRAAMKELKP
jgi:hypothetical protein